LQEVAFSLAKTIPRIAFLLRKKVPGSQNTKEHFDTLCPSRSITILKVVCYSNTTWKQ